jgi:hypothetical protein
MIYLPRDPYEAEIVLRCLEESYYRQQKEEEESRHKHNTRASINEQYKNARVCPHCGDRAGFSFGTGDCGCETSFEVGEW